MLKKIVLSTMLASLMALSFNACSSDDGVSDVKDRDDVNGEINHEADDDHKPAKAEELKINVVKSSLQYKKSSIDSENLNQFVEGQYDLNFDILRKSSAQIEKQNAMISTLSIQSALAMAWAGARNETAAEMTAALHFDENTHSALNKLNELVLAGRMDAVENNYEQLDAVDININNDLYLAPEYQWSESWLDLLASNYDSGVTEMNFSADPEAARKYINDAVAKDTHDRIKELIPKGSISVMTRNVLTNAIYFKAPWNDQFNVYDEKLQFAVSADSTVEVDSIAGSRHWPYNKTDDYEAVSISLRGGNFRMMFILPNDIEAFVANANGESMLRIINDLSSRSIIAVIPKFQFETSVGLREPLQALGMKQAFDDVSADFSGMTQGSNSLFIGDVVHKSFIGVDENGVEAAAATAVVMDAKSADDDLPVNFVLNRPFVFVVYENNSKTPLFVGRVLDPSK